jgi:hypothetical protein
VRAAAAGIVKTIFDTIVGAVKKGDTVGIVGFGTVDIRAGRRILGRRARRPKGIPKRHPQNIGGSHQGRRGRLGREAFDTGHKRERTADIRENPSRPQAVPCGYN